jgi:hypothetical protein
MVLLISSTDFFKEAFSVAVVSAGVWAMVS